MTTFPDFKPLTVDDRDAIQTRLWAYQPDTSELGFGNLYIWRTYYNFEWAIHDEWLLLVAHRPEHTFAFEPIGPTPRHDVTCELLRWLRDEHGEAAPFIPRADQRLVDELDESGATDDLTIEPQRDHFDYVYLTEDLIELSGRKYSGKRNHINNFLRRYEYEYRPLTEDLVEETLALAEVWCEQRSCEEDISLSHEFEGIKDTMDNFGAVGLKGGVLIIDGKVQAFVLGEQLNEETAVIHVEKANPDYRGIYPMMTQQFPEHRWADLRYINREQDLGISGLRRAKESYYPDHLVNKYRITLKE